MIWILEIIGTIVFAVSGAMTGIMKKMDLLGVTVLGMTTAVGGGIIRDIIIGVTPPAAFEEPIYAILAAMVSVIVFLPPIRKHIHLNGVLITVLDAVGLGVFTVVGVRAADGFQNGYLESFVGVMTGCGGGVLRDIFASERPTIFVKHFYACASLIGAVVCVMLLPYDENSAMAVGTVLIIAIRLLAVRYRWNLPKA